MLAALDGIDARDGQDAAFRLSIAVLAFQAAREQCLEAPVVVLL